MARKNVLIVARTRMYGAKVCVGTLSDQGEYLRLMNRSCESDQAGKVPYRIGQWWEVDCEACGEQRPPHVEDVSVTSARQIGEEEDLSGYLLNNTTPWKGTMDGSEFVLACDMRFAARESAIFGQPEPALGALPGGGASQHLARLMGRARALEVMLSGEDYNADLAERYGWINRALPAAELNSFVKSLAHRIAGFPSAGQLVVKDRINSMTLAPVEDFRVDSDLFAEGVRAPEAQSQIQAAMERGFQTRDAEMNLGRMLGELAGFRSHS